MKKIVTHFAMLFASVARNNAGWKLDADGKIEMKDGNPVWVDANGGESVLDGSTINRLNGEAKKLRERAEKAEETARAFEGLDASKAREAIDKLKDIDLGKLVENGKLDEVKNQITAQFQQQIAERDKALNELQSKFDNSQVSNLFAGSEFIRERVALPADMFEAYFRQNVKVNNGQIEFYDKAGNRLMSKAKIGEYADASEAFELLVNNHPQKDVILKADSGNGTGNNGGGGNRGAGRIVRRADFEKLSAQQQADTAKKASAGELQIVD